MSQFIDIVEIKLPPKPEYVGVARLTLSGVANRMGFTYDEIEDIKIATSEAITNAVQHAYKNKEKGIIQVNFLIYQDKLEIIVCDQGDQIDLAEVTANNRPYSSDETFETMRTGGLGLYLIETLMDEVNIVSENGLTVYMTKFLEREQVERDAKAIST